MNGAEPTAPSQDEVTSVTTFPHALSRTAKAWRRLMNVRLAGLGLSQAKWIALLLLDKSDDGIMQRELACSMGIECASLAGLLDRMAADGWIERRPCASDRRAKLVYLTGKSRTTLDEIHRIAREVSEQLLEGIPAEKLAACEEVLTAIEKQAQRLTAAVPAQP